MEGHLICWRCGVEFDPTPFREGSPCPDCQLDMPGDWLKGRLRSGSISAEEKRARMAAVEKQYKLGKLDPEIALVLGMHHDTVGKYRRALGLKPHYRPEKHMWKDQEAHMEHAAQMVTKRKSVGRGRRVENFEGSDERWNSDE